MPVLNTNTQYNHLTAKMFLDSNGGPGMQRFDTLKYRQFDKLTDKQLGFFWRPEEVDILRDAKDFKDLAPHEQHIFTSNLKRQILLDSVQGRSPNLVFLPIVSLPELETWIETWSFSETIHSRSYTHIIRNVYSDPSKIFDEMSEIKEIVDCADSITEAYDALLEYNQLRDKGSAKYNEYEHKKRIWKCLMSVNILEGVRFYVSFACSWAFAEVKKMEGNAKIIKLIARDENLHLGSTQLLLKTLRKDDPDFDKIAVETEEECIKMFVDAVNQEKAWADYLFKDGSMIGLNETLLHQYVEYIANRRLKALGLNAIFDAPVNTNPLPWTTHWLSSSGLQVAPQETEVESYIVGGVKQDVEKDTFKGFTL